MNDYQWARAGGADAQQHFLANQVNLFLFDLKNEACEHGFGAKDYWTLLLATDEEMVSLKKRHHLMISLKLNPDVLLNVFQEVKNKLRQSLSKYELTLTASDLARDGIRQMAAYPALQERS